MSTEIMQMFDYQGQQVRTVIRDGEPWWVAKDVCDVFGETNRNRAMQALDEDEKGYTQMSTPGGIQQIAVVNEAGLYALLFTMQPTKARGVSEEYIADREQTLRSFKRWITHEVLPSIRKDGLYVTPEMLFSPDHLLRVTQRLVEEHKARLEAERQLQLQAPKVELYDILLSAKNAQTMNEVAKSFGWGRNRLFAYLRERGILMKNNLPYQQYLDTGYFEVREVSTQRGEFSVNVTQTLVTAKGIDFIGRLLRSIGPMETGVETGGYGTEASAR